LSAADPGRRRQRIPVSGEGAERRHRKSEGQIDRGKGKRFASAEEQTSASEVLTRAHAANTLEPQIMHDGLVDDLTRRDKPKDHSAKKSMRTNSLRATQCRQPALGLRHLRSSQRQTPRW
jgi:hypothetical protein